VILEQTSPLEQREAEEALIRKSQLDANAFKPLYEKYFGRIFRFVLHRAGDRALAADLTSQVFLKALLGIRKFEFRGLPFSSWLFRIAVNECHDYFRKSSRYRMVALDDAGAETLYEDIIADHHLDDLHDRLPTLLENLKDDELTLIELRYFEQRPFKEVSEILGITENHAKVKLYRILEKLKKKFLSKS
jgi:RNA polymerase sigma-70 factor (ECF subfamily)